jgi:preprotein translocase subunit SecG
VETAFMVLFLLCGVILGLLVLIQRGRGGGLAGAFGGAGGSSAFGTKTADIFGKATAVVGAIFFLMAIITAFVERSHQAGAPTSEAPASAPAPAPSPEPGGSPPAPTGGAGSSAPTP